MGSEEWPKPFSVSRRGLGMREEPNGEEVTSGGDEWVCGESLSYHPHTSVSPGPHIEIFNRKDLGFSVGSHVTSILFLYSLRKLLEVTSQRDPTHAPYPISFPSLGSVSFLSPQPSSLNGWEGESE